MGIPTSRADCHELRAPGICIRFDDESACHCDRLSFVLVPAEYGVEIRLTREQGTIRFNELVREAYYNLGTHCLERDDSGVRRAVRISAANIS